MFGGPLLASRACCRASWSRRYSPPLGDGAGPSRALRGGAIDDSIRLDDGKVEDLTTGLDRGAGVRVALGTSYGYAFSNRLDRDLLEAAAAASAALQEGEPGSVVDLTTREGPGTNRTDRPAGPYPAADKVAWLREMDDAARSSSPDVQVIGMGDLDAAAPDRGFGRPMGGGVAPADPARGAGRRRPRWGHPDRVLRPAACGGVELFDRFTAAETGRRRPVAP